MCRVQAGRSAGLARENTRRPSLSYRVILPGAQGPWTSANALTLVISKKPSVVGTAFEINCLDHVKLGLFELVDFNSETIIVVLYIP